MAELSTLALASLLAVSFAGSFITVALGIGGGVLVLAVMASLMPPAALIPVHGVIQLGSNAIRAAVLREHIRWPEIRGFALGAAIGVALGGMVAVELPASVVQAGVGLFVIWTVVMRPPAWLRRSGTLTGAISSGLTMFFGATGPFVAAYVKGLDLDRQTHVASHAAMMTVQHGLKVVAFGLLGFAFAPWALFMALMMLSGFAGTLLGRRVLLRLSDQQFKRALNVILVALSLQLIWAALTG